MEYFINGQLFPKVVVAAVVLLDFVGVQQIFREKVDGGSYFLEQVFRPDDFAGIAGHVPDHIGVDTLFGEDPLDVVQFGGICLENAVVLVGERVSQSVSFQSVFEFVQQSDRVLDVPNLLKFSSMKDCSRVSSPWISTVNFTYSKSKLFD